MAQPDKLAVTAELFAAASRDELRVVVHELLRRLCTAICANRIVVAHDGRIAESTRRKS